MPTEGAVKRAIQRERRKKFPGEPASALDAKVEGEWSQTLGHDEWLIGDVRLNEDRVLIFTTGENARILAVRTDFLLIFINFLFFFKESKRNIFSLSIDIL